MFDNLDSLIQGGSGVGLVANPPGVPFKCGTCRYFNGGVCHNSHPSLNNRKVNQAWCCNLFDVAGMRRIA